jgi:hypothetical protein
VSFELRLLVTFSYHVTYHSLENTSPFFPSFPGLPFCPGFPISPLDPLAPGVPGKPLKQMIILVTLLLYHRIFIQQALNVLLVLLTFSKSASRICLAHAAFCVPIKLEKYNEYATPFWLSPAKMGLTVIE